MPNITQMELEEFRSQYQAVHARALALRWRLDQGAEVEPGPLAAESEGELTPYDDVNPEPKGFVMAGLDIGPKWKVPPATPIVPIAEKKEPEPPPEWLTEETPAMQYTLEAYWDQTWQRVDLTIDEYDALKDHLAKLRGFAVPEETTCR